MAELNIIKKDGYTIITNDAQTSETQQKFYNILKQEYG